MPKRRYQAITADKLIAKLVVAGVVPPLTHRCIIDLRYDEPIRLYFDCIGDERWLALEPETLLQRGKVTTISAEDLPR